MKAALEADAASETTSVTAPPSTTSAPPAKPDATKPAADGKPAPASQDTGKPAAQGNEAKPGEEKLSAFEKAKKEKERFEENWKKFQDEKQQLRARDLARDAEIKSLKAQLAAATKRPASGKPSIDKNGLSASDYDGLAKKYTEEGNDAMAQAAREAAAELRAQAPQPAAEQPAGNAWEQPEFQAAWQGNIKELYAAHPHLTDPNHPETKAVNLLLKDEVYGKFFLSSPDGIKAAHEVAMLMTEARAGKELKTQLDAKIAEVKAKDAEIARLNGLLQPHGSLPTKPAPGQKKVEEMSPDEAEAHVHAMAQAGDRGEI